MRSVSDKRRENNDTHMMFSNFFLKIVPFMTYCGKIWCRQTGHRWHYITVHAPCMLDD